MVKNNDKIMTTVGPISKQYAQHDVHPVQITSKKVAEQKIVNLIQLNKLAADK